ncbi:NADP-dependent oxidoreductase [Lichenifustis flavocetrariae]|uniref:NADP-dependent oxidoreductase n=1 Tax=Lichenifustis flavocetrariae TaxID=2949735 RepID=A0AA42CS69_9HYPH|nr:NADP-dependent oxidoreductase [Lichenifustis flavocetrariae]MCW6513190.1 NADP-dependent oxidoreductase [Lichenifustis flavocetrariae]
MAFFITQHIVSRCHYPIWLWLTLSKEISMRTLRFSQYGEPKEVLRLEETDIPEPKAGHVRVKVHACGLNPADWALCRGLFAGNLPRGIGLDLSGTVDTIGEGVADVAVGDRVLGVPAYQDYASAGAADYAVLAVWTAVPAGLDLLQAAALPMAIETSFRCLDILGVAAGHTLFVYGAGTMIGFAAVQMARLRGARVIAAAGDTFAGQLRALGAEVTPYGAGMVERVRELAGGKPDLILDAGPVSEVLPDLLEVADHDARRIVTVSNHGPAAEALGVRNSFEGPLDYGALGEFARLAAEGRFKVPVARSFPLSDWRSAVDLSLTGRAQGKLMLTLNF